MERSTKTLKIQSVCSHQENMRTREVLEVAGLYTAQEAGQGPWAHFKAHPQRPHHRLCSPVFSCPFPGLADTPVGTADQSSYPIFSWPCGPPTPDLL